MSNKTLNMIQKLNNSSSSSNPGAFYNSDYEDYPALEQSVNIQVGIHYASCTNNHLTLKVLIFDCTVWMSVTQSSF